MQKAKIIGLLGSLLLLLGIVSPAFILHKGEAILARRFYVLGPWPMVVMLSFAVASAAFTLGARRRALLATGLTLVLLTFGGFAIAKALVPRVRAESQMEDPNQRDVRAEFSWGWTVFMVSASLITGAALRMKNPNHTPEPIVEKRARGSV